MTQTAIDPRIQRRADLVELNRLYGDHMYYECADRGYDFQRGAAARDAYYKASVVFHERYGERFIPNQTK